MKELAIAISLEVRYQVLLPNWPHPQTREEWVPYIIGGARNYALFCIGWPSRKARKINL